MDAGDYPITSLVIAAASGDEHAWYELVDRYTPLLACVLSRFGLTTVEIQDVAQTVWLRLVEHVGSLREPRALPAWIITTGKREALRCLSDRRTVPRDPLDASWSASPAEDAEPDAELLRAERHEALLAGMAELPTRQRGLLLLLAEDPPLSYAQVSERTGIRRGSIGPTRARALDRLRQTSAIRDHLGHAGMPTAPDGADYLDRAAAGDSHRPRERRFG